MKRRTTFSLDEETLELINDLANLYGVSKSVLLERAIKFIVNNGYETRLFEIKTKSIRKDNSDKADKEIEKNDNKGFKLTL